MEKILVIGSGASAVHFALTVLKKGYEVIMLDVGNVRQRAYEPAARITDLKTSLADPVSYFLGDHFESVIYPDYTSEYYGFPPNKAHVFREVQGHELRTNRFSPILSFAQGGLAEAWTGGVYAFNDDDLRDFPFDYTDIEPFYNEVARRIGISGVRDDLCRFIPFQEALLPPLDLDENSALILAEYRRQKNFLNHQLGCYFGRSRMATLSRDVEGRQGCSYLGRCLWGCPRQAFYTPSITLNECRKFPTFHYIPGMYVSHFKCDSKRRITHVVAKTLNGGKPREFPASTVVLGAGTLSSSKIFMESIYRREGQIIRLKGLMDNRQILVPFVNLKMIGKPYKAEAYQYHQVAFGMEGEQPYEYVHGLVTTLKAAMVHPIIQRIPFDLGTSTAIFRHIRTALGLVNVNLCDDRRDDNYTTLVIDQDDNEPILCVNYLPRSREPDLIKKTVKKVKRALRSLKCIVPPGMIHIRPMGASVHYAGTIPMSDGAGTLTTTKYCRSNDFDNLYVVDGTTFPFLPAKNITYTLMANAIRVAECSF